MGYHLYRAHNYSCSYYWEIFLWIVADYPHVPIHMALHHLVLMIRLPMENYRPQPLLVTCLPILDKATPLSSLPSHLRRVVFILMVQCILESLHSLSSSMDLLHQELMAIYCGNRLGVLLLLPMGMLILRTNNLDSNLLTFLHHNQGTLHLTNRCHPYSHHLGRTYTNN